MTKFRPYLLAYAVTAVCYLALDAVWLTLTGATLYKPILAAHLAPQVDWPAAALFYALYFVGVVMFAIRPGEMEKTRYGALLRGVMFGVIAYATYDLTNQATLSGWPWKLSLVDMAWGGCETAVTTLIARRVLRK